jgi:D-alanyl-D-alanine carboxypeptidase
MNIPSRRHSHRKLKFTVLIALIVVLVAACGVGTWYALREAPGTTSSSISKQSNTTSKPIVSAKPIVPSFNKSLLSTSDPASLWVIVNKSHPIVPLGYIPSDIVVGPQGSAVSDRMLADLNTLLTTASQQGITLQISSSYRSYDNQAILYKNYTARYGQAAADTISARAGHSEHQTGLAVDIGGNSNPACNFNACYGETVEGTWLAAHATENGFIVRYTPGNEAITGYNPEAWHLRYIGHELAQEMKKQNISTLEQFFGISGGTTYVN